MSDANRSTRHPSLRHRQLVVWLVVCAFLTPLLGTFVRRPQPVAVMPHHLPTGQRSTPAPSPPTHERHPPFCFLCVLGPVLLTVLLVRLQGHSCAVTEPRPRRDFPAREKPFQPQCRSRAPPRPARLGS